MALPRAICFGSINHDLTYRMPHIIRSGETVSSTARSTTWGGKGLNQAVALAAAGISTSLWARTGTDGEAAHVFLARKGVDTSLVQTDPCEPTGHAIIQLDGEGSNCIIIYPGANRAHRTEHIPPGLSGASAGDLLLVQNETNLVPEVVAEARSRGMRVAYNPSPMDAGARDLDLGQVDVLFVNEHEAAELAGSSSPDAALATLGERYPATEIVMTLGAEGSVWQRGSQRLRVDAVPVPVVDTTGAGDTFTGFFLGAQLRGHAPEEALRIASQAAALAVGCAGAAVSVPTWADLAR